MSYEPISTSSSTSALISTRPPVLEMLIGPPLANASWEQTTGLWTNGLTNPGAKEVCLISVVASWRNDYLFDSFDKDFKVHTRSKRRFDCHYCKGSGPHRCFLLKGGPCTSIGPIGKRQLKSIKLCAVHIHHGSSCFLLSLLFHLAQLQPGVLQCSWRACPIADRSTCAACSFARASAGTGGGCPAGEGGCTTGCGTGGGCAAAGTSACQGGCTTGCGTGGGCAAAGTSACQGGCTAGTGGGCAAAGTSACQGGCTAGCGTGGGRAASAGTGGGRAASAGTGGGCAAAGTSACEGGGSGAGGGCAAGACGGTAARAGAWPGACGRAAARAGAGWCGTCRGWRAARGCGAGTLCKPVILQTHLPLPWSSGCELSIDLLRVR